MEVMEPVNSARDNSPRNNGRIVSRGHEDGRRSRELPQRNIWHDPAYTPCVSSASSASSLSDSHSDSTNLRTRPQRSASFSRHRRSANTSLSNVSSDSGSSSSSPKPPPFETCPIALARRQKQIDYGKNTIEYKNYVTLVPTESRERYHARTPDRNKKCSRRCWDGQIKIWRLFLHAYDPENIPVNAEAGTAGMAGMKGTQGLSKESDLLVHNEHGKWN